MIDTNQVSAIQHRIAAQGIKQTGQLEELVDHYLTSLECKIENGEVPHQALLATLAEIDNANHNVSSTTYKKNFMLIAIITLFTIGGLYFFADANDPPSNIEPPITEQTSFPEAWPVEATSKEVSSGFGPRQHHYFKKIKTHLGIDIKASSGTPVLASSEGIVMEAGYHKFRGNYIVIQHNNTYGTRYMHLKDITVQPCDIVQTGESIGTVGSTGLSTAPHLHFEILEHGKAVNPMDYLEP